MARLTERTEDGEWWLKGLPWQSIFGGHALGRIDSDLIYGAASVDAVRERKLARLEERLEKLDREGTP